MKALPQKQTVSISDATLEYVRSNNGSPTIVLINGAGGPIEGWYRVFNELATIGTVFAYNRLGIGKSSKPTTPQTGAVMVEALRTLLLTLHLPPPYLLVAHSLGGLIANLFARCYPQEVVGVVFLDATAPEDIDVMTAHETKLQRFLKGTVELVFGTDALGETAHIKRTVELINQAPPFPEIPIVVVTGGKPALPWLTPGPALAARAAHQRHLATLSPKGKHIVTKTVGISPRSQSRRWLFMLCAKLLDWQAELISKARMSQSRLIMGFNLPLSRTLWIAPMVSTVVPLFLSRTQQVMAAPGPYAEVPRAELCRACGLRLARRPRRRRSAGATAGAEYGTGQSQRRQS